jgi:hypothetical protein
MEQQHFWGRPPAALLLAAYATERSVTRSVVGQSEESASTESIESIDRVDQQSDQSFPASDPPSFSGLSL